ncbi:MAG: hypothetical protein H6701_05455 [Myxococcales bacterium]|nr:hypothetical protein [Myxococcales bacterium]
MLAGGGLLLAASRASAADSSMQVEDYPEHPAGPFGPVWGHRRPPGLPTTARPCSPADAALPFIRAFAGPGGPEFVKVVEHLAETESGAMLGRPANTFDARPKNERGGAALITAWGCFQWNRDAIGDVRHMAAIGIPGFVTAARFGWEWSADDELRLPIAMYRQIWEWTRARRGTALDAARAVRLWHQASGVGRQHLERAARTHWQVSWALVPEERRAIVDRHIRAVGLVA